MGVTDVESWEWGGVAGVESNGDGEADISGGWAVIVTRGRGGQTRGEGRTGRGSARTTTDGWTGQGRGLGERVVGSGDGPGEGVRARGLSGMCPTDLRRLTATTDEAGELAAGGADGGVLGCIACLSPCSETGR